MRAVKLLAVALAALSVACGGRSLETEIQRHPAAVLPQGASQVFYANIERLKTNPLVVLVFEKADKVDWGPSLKGTSQTLPLAGDIAHLALGTYAAAGAGKPPSAVVVAGGRFSEDTFKKALETSRVPYIEGKYGKQGYYTCGRGDERCYVSFNSPRLLVAASQEDLLKRTLDLGRGKGKSVAGDRNVTALLESFSPNLDFWATGAFPSALAGAVDEQIQQAVQLITAFTVTLGGADPMRLDLRLHCLSSEAAQADAQFLKSLVSSIIQEIVTSGYPVSDLIAAVNRSKIVVEGGLVSFQLQLSKVEVAATASVLRTPPESPVVDITPRKK